MSAHGGSVDVFDTPGGGATFRVALPLFPEVGGTGAGAGVTGADQVPVAPSAPTAS